MANEIDEWSPKHRIDVREYCRMAELGLLAPDARVELIRGEIIDLPPTDPPCDSVVTQIVRFLVMAVADRAIVRVRSAFRLDNHSEPQPDLTLLRPRDNFYRDRYPGPADSLLVIEVAGVSCDYVRDVKVPLYARRGIPEVWLFDLEVGTLEIYRNPVEGTYTDVSITPTPGVLSVPGLDGVNVDLTGLLG